MALIVSTAPSLGAGLRGWHLSAGDGYGTTESDTYTLRAAGAGSGKFKIYYSHRHDGGREGTARSAQAASQPRERDPATRHYTEVVGGADVRKDLLRRMTRTLTWGHADTASPANGESPVSSRPTRMRRATTWTARRSCSIGRSTFHATRSCCRRDMR